MLGSENLRISRDSHSSQALSLRLDQVLEAGNLSHLRDEHFIAIEDDHIPFVEKGIESLNIIDFNNLDHWHKPTDIPDFVHEASLSLALEITVNLLLNLDILEAN